ncbi:MAG: glycosyltransferase family 1 protein [Alphaproteobacteria bacterium]|nr:glycosyltransferase family 1 protein [Alphaproteobacteria bacterium]
MKKIKYYLALILLFVVCAFCFYYVKKDKTQFLLDDNTPQKLRLFVSPLIDELNNQDFSDNKKYRFYFANFYKDHQIVKPKKNKNEIPVLWLGGYEGLSFYPDDLLNYPYIFVTSDLLIDFLKIYNLKLNYAPLGWFKNYDNFEVYDDNKLFGIIGAQPLIKDILEYKKIPYKEYNIENIDEIVKDIPKLKACFVNHTSFENKSIDLHPIFFRIASHKIPIATYWGWPLHIDTINIFNDAINFYMTQDDAEILIDEILNNDKKIIVRKHMAYLITKNIFSKDAIINTIKTTIEGNHSNDNIINKHSINFDLGVSVGHIGSGDFWLAQDIASHFTDQEYEQYMSFFDSIKKYSAQNNVLIRGFLPVKNKDLTGNNNFLFIAYPQFAEIDKKEMVISFEEYVQNIIDESDKFKAVFVSSIKLNNELQKKGVNSFYIPQFTNTERFYPDFNKELETDVVFVGVNAFYRKAVHYLRDAGINVNIYGPKFDEGVALKEYLDNRILRKYYSSAKIVLNDTREGMKNLGFISNRIFDASACGSLVISDYMKEIEDIYGDSVPMWKTKEELIKLVRYYLDPKNENERKEKIKKAQKITLKNFTSDIISHKIQKIIEESDTK